jgi:hypothetical protein
MWAGFRHILLMISGSLRFSLNLATFPQVCLFYYSDWQDVQALAPVITEVIVIALQLHWSPKGEKTFVLRT